ncbi:uncharacterized protein EV422DRAFT_547455 [Fimicolochytrium jonesii]|uniref:uncharacterized protein n=1 Tax=Fimicolochytrium jonesii TaxID=1396493 RepID=UPI0022FEF329|nr:uncharacterized protein EV422DRAFT_547455 [Fimicolochytrium jonesii]KAI8816003.1 hypothetical protein EV422DRAFT_547455 [Fimicolochytrium jonesii]
MASEYTLKDRNTVVLGASSGIGKAIAEALAAEGANLVLLSRKTESLSPLITSLTRTHASIKVHPVQCDLTSDESMDRAASDIGKLFNNTVHVLVNNAGVGGKSVNAIDAKWEDWELVLRTDLRGVMRFTTLILPYVKDIGRGSIINIASVAGRNPIARNVDYSAAKHGLVGFSLSLFEDIRELGIKVTAINPGYVNTPLVDKVKGDKSKMIQPEDIAKTVVFVAKFPDTGCPTEITIRPQRNIK